MTTFSVHDVAKSDFAWLKNNEPEIYAALVAELKAVSLLNDPRDHCRVKAMTANLNGCYRLAIYQPVSIRIVFRLLNVRAGVLVEVQRFEALEGETFGEIIRAGKRGWVYRDESNDRLSAVRGAKKATNK